MAGNTPHTPTTNTTASSLFMSCIYKKAGERLARAVRNSGKETPQAPMATNPRSSTNIGRRSFRENPPPAPTCTPVLLHVVLQDPPPHRVWGVLRKPHLPLPALFIWESDWIRMQFLDFSRMPSVMLHQNLGLSLSCRKMEPNPTTKSVSSLQLKAGQPRKVVR